MESITERIMYVCESNGGNKSEFARKLNVTPAYISKISKNMITMPSDLFISALCEKYNVNETWLRTGDGLMNGPLSKEQEIASITSSLFHDYDDIFKRKLIKMISKLNYDEMRVLEKLAQKTIDEYETEIIYHEYQDKTNKNNE